jgi:hypothetical protein
LSADKQVELSIYLGKDLVRSYTTADLEKMGAAVERDAMAAESGIRGPENKTPMRAKYEVAGCFQVWNTNDYYFKLILPHPGNATGDGRPDAKELRFDIVTGKRCEVRRHAVENKEEMKLLD